MALLTHRVDRAFIDVGVFTNLTQDHLDDHGTMENYRDAKLRLFQGLCRRAVVNADDPVGAGIRALMPGAVDHVRPRRRGRLPGDRPHHGRLGHALHPAPRRPQVPGGDPRPRPVLRVQRAGRRGGLPRSWGTTWTGLVAALDRMPPIPGRFERFETPAGTSVIVDYAHSPDSLDKVLTAIRGFASGRVITVFGCGGDRDATKRARMGEIAGTYSDLCVLTSDNPRERRPRGDHGPDRPGSEATGTPSSGSPTAAARSPSPCPPPGRTTSS